MRKLSVVVCLVFHVCGYAQNRTNVWELGYSDTIAYPNFEMRYNSGTMDTAIVFRSMPMNLTNASICDSDGNIIVYSNGFTIGNKIHGIMQNATDFNPGWLTDWTGSEGLLSCQAILILPYPGDYDRYILLHESGELFQGQVQPLYLGYSCIDANLDGGLGGIIDSLKNKHVIEDTLSLGGITAAKHANGRDWWVIVHRYNEEKYYKLLFSPNGIDEISGQSIGTPIKDDALVQASFSPDGDRYCFASSSGVFELMNFDRCTGDLSNLISNYLPDSLGIAGCSFSPNSRFLYASSQYNLYQYDTWNNNMLADVIHIATWDTFESNYGIPILFFMHQLAPDGKIYIAGWNSSEFIHVINFPDSLGFACDFEQHSYVLPDYYNVSIPSFPNYDLGALEGSPCDTLTIPLNVSTLTQPPTFRITPNPASNYLNIIYQSNEDALLELYDLYGKRVAAASLYHYFKNRLINVSALPAGVYLVSVMQKGKEVWREKLVIQHY